MPCSTPVASRVMPPGPEAAKAARDFLAVVCCPAHAAGVVQDAQLLVSELVGNAVRYGLPPIEVVVHCCGAERLEVRVRDTGGGAPEPRATPNSFAPDDAENGRGLTIVDVISDDWGALTEPDGTTVWFQ